MAVESFDDEDDGLFRHVVQGTMTGANAHVAEAQQTAAGHIPDNQLFLRLHARYPAASTRRDTARAVIEPHVLVLEDDAELRALVTRGLREEGFHVTTAATADDAMRQIGESDADALVVDIGLPDADGRDVVQALRSRGVGAPVIFLSARDELPDRLAGFAAGGDDYLTKPFAFAELVARLRALIKRGGSDLALEGGGLRLDPSTHGASCNGRAVELTPTEFRILARLVGAPGDAVRRRELVQVGWPHGAIVHDNTLDVYIGRLRRKLSSLPSAPEIATVHGVGYSLR